MARGTQHRKRRPQTNARVAAGQPARRRSGRSGPAYEEQLFFGRLRNHAKWVFVLLAARVRRSASSSSASAPARPGSARSSQNFFSGTSAIGTSLSLARRRRRSSIRRTRRPGSPTRTSSSRRASSDDAAAALTTYTTLEAEGHRTRCTQLAAHLPSPRPGLEDALPRRSSAVHADARRPARSLDAEVELAARQGARVASRTRSRPRSRRRPRRRRATPTSRCSSYLSQRVDVYKKIAKLEPEGRDDAALARAGGVGRAATRRRRSRPTRRSSSSRRATPPAPTAAQGAEAARGAAARRGAPSTTTTGK